MTIGEVAAKAGVKTSAIRYYEAEGLIPKPARSSGRRVFSESVFDHLALIQLAQAAGFSIAEIRGLKRGLVSPSGPGPRWRELAQRKSVELDETIRVATRMKRLLKAISGCDCPTLEDCARAARGSPRPR